MRLMLPSLVITAALVGVVGCTNTSWRNHIPLATPLQPALQQEVVLARIGQLLSSRILTSDEQAQLLYEQGVLYDSLGLRALARNSFAMALNIRPDMPEAFNYLGIYFTQARDFDAAYEAFDSALELDPTYNNAYLNRGIAFYYGDRYRLSQDDLLAFYKDDPNDPYRVLWLYLTEKKLNAGTAKQLLQQRYRHAKVEQWGWNIVRFYLGDINQLTLMASANKNATNNTMLAEHLSELDFYLGKYYLSLGDKNDAAALFKLTVANNVHNFIEHRCALLELALLGQEQDDLSESDL